MVKCAGTTQSGIPCKRDACENGYCPSHKPASPKRASPAKAASPKRASPANATATKGVTPTKQLWDAAVHYKTEEAAVVNEIDKITRNLEAKLSLIRSNKLAVAKSLEFRAKDYFNHVDKAAVTANLRNTPGCAHLNRVSLDRAVVTGPDTLTIIGDATDYKKTATRTTYIKFRIELKMLGKGFTDPHISKFIIYDQQDFTIG
jgi:hypothetical protein